MSDPLVAREPPAASTVLVVDDDAQCRQFLAIALRGAGCSVLVADGGPAALQVADTFAGPIHLILCDVVMPGMGGRELVALLLQKRPDARVLFISGYVDDPVLRAGVSSMQHRLLQKPFSVADAVAAVREALA